MCYLLDVISVWDPIGLDDQCEKPSVAASVVGRWGLTAPSIAQRGAMLYVGFLESRLPIRLVGPLLGLEHGAGALGVSSPMPCRLVRVPPMVVEGSML